MSIRNRRRAIGGILTAEFFRHFHFAEDIRLLFARFQEREPPVGFGDDQFPVRKHQRPLANTAAILLPHRLAGFGIQTMHIGRVVFDIQLAIIDRAGGKSRFNAIVLPEHFWLTAGAFKADDTAERGIVDVFQIEHRIDARIVDDHR